MAQSANVKIDISSKADTRGFKVAETALQKMNKQIKVLAGTLGIAYGAKAIFDFGKASVKAFAADEKAAKSLAVALKNTGNGFATIATEGFIARMQDTYKVLDDELRPAFQTLLNATGSITTAQKGLQLALDVSAGTTKDLASVSAALAKGYSGQTTALSRLGAGLDKATLASGDMDKITAALTAKFSGQALAATKTYTGQMNALAVASANAKEEIGKGILDSIALLAGSDGLQTATSNMENFGKATADTIFLMASLVKTFKDSGLGKLFGLSVFANIGGLAKLGEKARGSQTGKGVDYSPTSMYFTVEQAERAKLNSTLKKSNIIETAKQKLAKADLINKQKQAELDELKKKFDVNRINLEIALMNAKDDAEKARIQGLLTIMDDDANAAAKRLAELDSANALKMKAELAAADTLKYLAQEADRAAKGLASIGNPAGNYGYTAANPSFVFGQGNVPDAMPNLSNAGSMGGAPIDYGYTAANPSFTYSPPIVNNITIEAPNGSEEYLTEAVKRAMQKLNRYGDSMTFAGAL